MRPSQAGLGTRQDSPLVHLCAFSILDRAPRPLMSICRNQTHRSYTPCTLVESLPSGPSGYWRWHRQSSTCCFLLTERGACVVRQCPLVRRDTSPSVSVCRQES